MSHQEIADFGGGCFWCVEAVFKDLQGVEKVTSGYMGGHVDNPSYRQICGGDTGHAEIARIVFDPAIISYDQLLQVFFATHDPTQLNRQGNDIGTQYRSVVFYHSEAQRAAAQKAKEASAALWDGRPVTEISPAPTFWPAEDYHQDYFENNPTQPYCLAVVAPKVRKARSAFARLLKS